MTSSPERRLVALLGCPELAPALKARGFATQSFASVKKLLDRIGKTQARACVVRPDYPDAPTVREIVQALRGELPFTDVVLWTPAGPARQVRDALTAGARDVVLARKLEEVASTVTTVVEQQKILPRLELTDNRSRDTWTFEGLVSRSRKMWDIFAAIDYTASLDATVLVLGETGTGKELVARAIHHRSGRKGRFVGLNCGAIPETLIDSELFGHVRGAFTGATRDKRGLFLMAEGGTLLLDEIGNIPLPAQYRLLRSLQESSIRPVGSDRELPTDVRVIAATSSELEEAVVRGTFREDLLYRLDVIRIVIPPLRQRREDILLLFEHFSRKLALQYGLQRPEVTGPFLDALQEYDWPGNVRQLENYAERLLLTLRGEPLAAKHFRRLIKPYRGRHGPSAPTAQTEPDPLAAIDLERPLTETVTAAVEQLEADYLRASLRQNRGRIGETAEQAGISRRTLCRKLKQYGIDKRAFRRGDGMDIA